MQIAESFIKDQFPAASWPVVPRVLKQAYAAADSLIKDSPILNVQSAQDNRGRIISYAVDLGFERAVASSAIECDCRWVEFERPTGRYLQLRFAHSTASISQVSQATRQPRNVCFRENARLKNQFDLDFLEFREEKMRAEEPHFLIIHGYQELTFAHLGLPSATSKASYEWRSNNLLDVPHEIVAEGPSFEDTDFDFNEVDLLKEGIERWRRDNGESH
ncbi:MAG: hypothetical protein AXW12_18780 [Thalassospira sp. Nap_22]|nr:MAG: hypothetical protein AXW12_18780 [Thalassospira sp. Nap_22]